MPPSQHPSKTVPPTDERATTAKFDARRNEIIDLAAALFARNAYAATSVAEISEAANLGKGGLYYYIGSKEAILVEIHERVMRPLMAATRRIVALEADPVVQLRLVSELLLVVVTERRDHVWVFLHEHRALKGEMLERFRARRREFEDVVASFFAQGAGAGLLHLDDLRLTTLAFLGMHNSSYQWIRADGRRTPQEVSATYSRIFFAGVAAADVDFAAVEDDVARWRKVLDGAFSA